MDWIDLDHEKPKDLDKKSFINSLIMVFYREN